MGTVNGMNGEAASIDNREFTSRLPQLGVDLGFLFEAALMPSSLVAKMQPSSILYYILIHAHGSLDFAMIYREDPV